MTSASSSASSKRAHLLPKKDIVYISSILKDIDVHIVVKDVIARVELEHHITLFEDRKQLWGYMVKDGRARLCAFIKHCIDAFGKLFKEYCRGSNRQAKLLIEWNNLAGSYAVESLSTLESQRFWEELVSGYHEGVSNECRSTVISTVLNTLYSFAVTQVHLLLTNLASNCASNITSLAPEADDDIALYRLFGFSLHASITTRKNALGIGKRKKSTRISSPKLSLYRKQLKVLQSLIEHKKTTTAVPAVIQLFQDRGKMTFPHRILLSFCRRCSLEIKRKLNVASFRLSGRGISRVRFNDYYRIQLPLSQGGWFEQVSLIETVALL